MQSHTTTPIWTRINAFKQNIVDQHSARWYGTVLTILIPVIVIIYAYYVIMEYQHLPSIATTHIQALTSEHLRNPDTNIPFICTHQAGCMLIFTSMGACPPSTPRVIHVLYGERIRMALCSRHIRIYSGMPNVRDYRYTLPTGYPYIISNHTDISIRQKQDSEATLVRQYLTTSRLALLGLNESITYSRWCNGNGYTQLYIGDPFSLPTFRMGTQQYTSTSTSSQQRDDQLINVVPYDYRNEITKMNPPGTVSVGYQIEAFIEETIAVDGSKTTKLSYGRVTNNLPYWLLYPLKLSVPFLGQDMDFPIINATTYGWIPYNTMFKTTEAKQLDDASEQQQTFDQTFVQEICQPQDVSSFRPRGRDSNEPKWYVVESFIELELPSLIWITTLKQHGSWLSVVGNVGGFSQLLVLSFGLFVQFLLIITGYHSQRSQPQQQQQQQQKQTSMELLPMSASQPQQQCQIPTATPTPYMSTPRQFVDTEHNDYHHNPLLHPSTIGSSSRATVVPTSINAEIYTTP